MRNMKKCPQRYSILANGGFALLCRAGVDQFFMWDQIDRPTSSFENENLFCNVEVSVWSLPVYEFTRKHNET